MGLCNRQCRFITQIVVGVLFTVSGLVLALIWSSVYTGIVEKELILTNSSKSYNLWKETPIPMYLSIYFFNWTNSEEVLSSKWSVKPELKEVGPYIFSEHHVRVNLKWNTTNGTVTYQQKRVWKFLREKSNGTLSDIITNLNPVAATIGKKAKNHPVWKVLANKVLNGFEKSIVLSKPVNQLLFDGYDDFILSIIHKYDNKSVPFSKFGWFYSRNNSETYDGTFTIYTGATDLNLLGVLSLWNGKHSTSCYESYCSYVNGTSGELWPPIKTDQNVSLFSSDICSSLLLSYKDDDVLNGLTGRRYIGTSFSFDNGTGYPQQTCFHGENIVPSGVRDISKCRYEVPIFISYPHFYLADPSYLKRVNGLKPNKAEHEMYLTLEPTTGIPLDVRAQLQISIFVEPISGLRMFENVKATYMPALWFRQSATLTEEFSDTAKVLVDLKHVGAYVGWSIFSLGIIASLVGAFMVLRILFREEEEESLIESEETQSESH